MLVKPLDSVTLILAGLVLCAGFADCLVVHCGDWCLLSAVAGPAQNITSTENLRCMGCFVSSTCEVYGAN
jgi:hypothetical protein